MMTNKYWFALMVCAAVLSACADGDEEPAANDVGGSDVEIDSGADGGATGGPPTTTASPGGGTYDDQVTVELHCVDDSACAETSYWFDSDGLEPQEYRGPIEITRTTQLHFFSLDDEGNREEPQVEAYEIRDTRPPVVISTDPEQGAQKAAGAQFIVTFDEPVVLEDPQSAISCPGVAFAVVSPPTAHNLIVGSIETFTPLEARCVVVSGEAGGIKDTAGNYLAEDYPWTFSVSPRPVSLPPTETTQVALTAWYDHRFTADPNVFWTIRYGFRQTYGEALMTGVLASEPDVERTLILYMEGGVLGNVSVAAGADPSAPAVSFLTSIPLNEGPPEHGILAQVAAVPVDDGWDLHVLDASGRGDAADPGPFAHSPQLAVLPDGGLVAVWAREIRDGLALYRGSSVGGDWGISEAFPISGDLVDFDVVRVGEEVWVAHATTSSVGVTRFDGSTWSTERIAPGVSDPDDRIELVVTNDGPLALWTAGIDLLVSGHDTAWTSPEVLFGDSPSNVITAQGADALAVVYLGGPMEQDLFASVRLADGSWSAARQLSVELVSGPASLAAGDNGFITLWESEGTFRTLRFDADSVGEIHELHRAEDSDLQGSHAVAGTRPDGSFGGFAATWSDGQDLFASTSSDGMTWDPPKTVWSTYRGWVTSPFVFARDGATGVAWIGGAQGGSGGAGVPAFGAWPHFLLYVPDLSELE